MSEIDNSAQLNNDTTVQTPVASIPGSTDTPASTTGPADTAVDGQPKEGEGEPPKEPTRDRRAEKRIASLSRKNDEANREIGYWRGIAEARQSQGQPAPAAENTKPQPNQFKSYDEYTEALTDWKVDEKLKARETERATQDRTQAENGKENERKARVADRLFADAKDIEDFDDVMQVISAKGFPISAAMRDYLEEAERPAHVAQWLADNRDKAGLIYGMNSAQVVRELDKVAKDFAPKPARTSSAPPPGPTVGGRAVVTRDPEKMDMEEYKASVWDPRQAKKH